MRLYLDTEFNGFGGELISMALVSPEGPSWYRVRSVPLLRELDPWVREHVIPKWHFGSGTALDNEQFREALHAFLLQFDNPEIICDWHTDAEHFCRWLDGLTYERSLDYACRITILKTPPGQPVSENPHNALADAEALMRWHMATKQ